MAVVSEQIARPRSVVQGSAVHRGPLDLALQVVTYVVLIFVAFLMFTPFIFSVVTSLKSGREANQVLTLKSLFIPENPTLDAYRTVFDSDIEHWFLNSVFVAVIWVFARAFTA